LTFPSTGARSRPILDETGFQQLLAAAYVLQQHNDSLRAQDPRLDTAWIFSQIAETESLVREGRREVLSAASLIADRLCKMSDAASVGICLMKDGGLECIANAGAPNKIPGGSIASKSAVAAERLKNGRQFQSLDAQVDVRLDADLCRGLGIRSLLAIPIQQAGEIAGLIEIRWRGQDALHECDVRTCQLMAGLLTEVLERESESRERTTTQLLDLNIEKTTAPDAIDHSSNDGFLSAKNEASTEPVPKTATEYLAVCCRVCGRPFQPEETFCGNCSMPRVAASDPGDGLQSKWASMWFMQQAQDTLQERRETKALAPIQSDVQEKAVSPSPPPLREREMERPLFTPPRALLEPPVRRPVMQDPVLSDLGIHEAEPNPEARAESFLSSPRLEFGKWLGHSMRSLHPIVLRLRIGRRAMLLGACTLIFVLVLTIWSAWPSRSSSQLTWFESLLVELGLAEVPSHPAPVYAGNPDVRVWEDVHTALYYCPGSDLYGKTPGGRFSTQRNAEEDQFESATRIACE
jgi:GAF domain